MLLIPLVVVSVCTTHWALNAKSLMNLIAGDNLVYVVEKEVHIICVYVHACFVK